MRTLTDIAERVERELAAVYSAFSLPPFSAIESPYRDAIVSYLARKGKRLRPTLFVIGYDGYSPQPAPNRYRSAIALEFLHDFILVHDDIVDRSRTRRGGPAMHACFDQELAKHPGARFSGRDAAMIVGDMLYAMGLNLFLSVEERPERKTRAMDCLTQAAVFTACGELKEILDSLTPAGDATAERLVQTAEWKTAYYSFACPLVTGATLAGAADPELSTLRQYALSVGLAFQIRDDILDLTIGHDPATGEQELGDLREGKLTLPVWYALNNSTGHDKARLQALLDGTGSRSLRALKTARNIIVASGGVARAQRDVVRHAAEGTRLLNALTITDDWRQLLATYTAQMLGLELEAWS